MRLSSPFFSNESRKKSVKPCLSLRSKIHSAFAFDFYVNSIKDCHAKNVEFLLILEGECIIAKKIKWICSFFNKNS